jgi:pyruvate,orthophosphate dikinase
MFFEADRVKAMREMILSDTQEQRKTALDKILPFQQKDFEGMFKALEGRPMTVRYLDPPLHEFLPQKSMVNEIKEIAEELGTTVEELNDKIDELHEFNPMMGHRGCRLSVTYPEIAQMQTRAIIQAAINVRKEEGYDIVPELMIPLIGSKAELKYVKNIVEETIKEVFKENNTEIKYHIGTMIEIPRACLTADEIAEEADFFSFGTNDLTQMGFGFSRDDAGKFLESYYASGILEFDPFARLDFDGIGKFVEMAVKLGRKTKPELKIGICGEHGGDPATVEFCHNTGLDYVSCSPFRVPIARLAAAHAAIKEKMAK